MSCHQNPITGSSSQISELRVGHHEPLIPTTLPSEGPLHRAAQRVADPTSERSPPRLRNTPLPEYEVKDAPHVERTSWATATSRSSPTLDILAIRKGPARGHEGPGRGGPGRRSASEEGDPAEFETVERLGRFGWKCQEASLINFSRRCLPERDGDHQPAPARGESRRTAGTSRRSTWSPTPEDQVDPKDPDNRGIPSATTSSRSPGSCGRPRRRPGILRLLDSDDVKEGEKLFRNNDAAGMRHLPLPDHTTPAPGTPIRAAPRRDGTKPAATWAWCRRPWGTR